MTMNRPDHDTFREWLNLDADGMRGEDGAGLVVDPAPLAYALVVDPQERGDLCRTLALVKPLPSLFHLGDRPSDIITPPDSSAVRLPGCVRRKAPE